ncbi:helix-turn-helix domain-containing protein [Streptomyces sp. NPDC056638]|uniref:helix-turn-helix domain-containing protein n=1 Tax=Streptomyces sp. NPDC056638 TaxID=3345887 RepID=UPI003691E1DF
MRYLHKLFQLKNITVSRWIQQRRLERCRRALSRREAAGLTIAAVAHHWGFTSVSPFSRVSGPLTASPRRVAQFRRARASYVCPG